jgi:hypothetical protein
MASSAEMRSNALRSITTTPSQIAGDAQLPWPVPNNGSVSASKVSEMKSPIRYEENNFFITKYF